MPDSRGMETVVLLLIVAALFGALGAAVSSSSKRGLGFLLGFLLGPIGIIVAAIAAKNVVPQMTVYHSTAPTSGGQQHSPHNPDFRSPLDDAPMDLTIRRDGAIIGTWPLADALDYIEQGLIAPSDYYLRDPEKNIWSLVSRLMSSTSAAPAGKPAPGLARARALPPRRPVAPAAESDQS